MNKKNCTVLALGICLCLLLIVSGCDIQIGDWGKAKYERTVQQQAPLAPGSTVVAKTSFGSVTITGADVTDCNVVAQIRVQAPTEQEAQKIAKQVKIKLEPVGKTLTVKVEKPPKKRRRSISISYNITVPKQTNVECGSSFGAIKLSDIDGNVKGKTSSGSISAEDIQGSAQLNTSFGSITCKGISGDNINIKSSSGSITAESIEGSSQLETSFGSITCNDISGGDVKLKTSSGKIKLSNGSFGDCDAHTSFGSLTADELKGSSLKLHSGSGSINVTESSANITNVSTSYGRITCRQLTTADLTAKSGSGSIEIDCSDSTPAEITANVVSSYGSIDFVTPPEFTGQVDLSTGFGSIRTDLPITITGEISKKNLTGTIGQGNGKLYLKTSSGSIKIR